MSVSGNLPGWVTDLAADRDVELHPDLLPWVEESDTFGPMLRHPLVYEMFLGFPGVTNKTYLRKTELVKEALADEDWDTYVFLHERPYRLRALLDVTGRNEFDEPMPLVNRPEHWALAADVWVDSENIQQNINEWRDLLCNGEGLWLGTDEEREAFDALPRVDHINGPHIKLWRGGAVGDWSWTADEKVAQFFSRRSGYPVRSHLIPVADVFGYLTRRSEAEALVKFTEFRRTLVYPNGEKA